MRYIGVDLTSGLVDHPRPVDLAIIEDNNVEFQQWDWPQDQQVIFNAGPALANHFLQNIDWNPDEMRLAIDGPQALATIGHFVRIAELELATPGRTPDEMPLLDRPFGSYIQSSIFLFRALLAFGERICLPNNANHLDASLYEIFPGSEWQVLFGRRLPKKASRAGREARATLFRQLGLDLPHLLPSADQNDALIGACLLRWAEHEPQRVRLVGEVAQENPLREGFILHSARRANELDREDVEVAEPADMEVPDWAADVHYIRFTDNGCVWRKPPENRWLEIGVTYTLEACGQHFTLSPLGGDVAWGCDPTVQALLGQLGIAPIPQHLSAANSISVAVAVINEEEAGG